MIDNIIEEQSQLYPLKTAIKYHKETISYNELNLNSEKASNYLKNRNWTCGCTVAIIMDRSIAMITILIGVIKSGAAFLPIDPELPAERIAYLLQDVSADVILTSEKYKGRYNANAPQVIIGKDFGDDELTVSGDPNKPRTGSAIIYVLYTSGSTGSPKGVRVTHDNLLNLLLSIQRLPGISSQDNMLAITTISFDISILEIFLPLISGAQLTLVDKATAKDGRALLALIKSENITIVQATPFTWYLMLEYGWEEYLPIKAFCGGEALSKDLAAKLLSRCKQLWNLYGPTETTIYSTRKQIKSAEETITIGTPIENTEIYILDEQLNQVADGNVGELFISGAGVADGYQNKPALTAEKFLDDKFSSKPEQKMYRTGDLGRITKNNEIECLGRIDHQIKIRGFRIEPQEIEHQLKRLENIKVAVVVAFNDSVDNLRLIAYLVIKTDIKEDDLTFWRHAWKTQLKNVLPEYMVPSDFIIIPAIPVMINGKIDKKALPSPASNNLSPKYVAPTSEMEIQMTEIWELNLRIKGIGVYDSFFDLGGNSLIAVKIMTRLEQLIGKRLALSLLISHPTIKQLCSVLKDGTPPPEFKSLIPVKSYGSKVPLYIVHGIGLNVLNFRNMIFNLDKEQPVYSIQAVGLNDKDEPLNSIEEIAAFYNSEIIANNPGGPYAIAGYSFGGFIAYEMVKQLKDQGRDVRLLIMFDTNLPLPTHQYSLKKKISVKLWRLFPKFKFRVGSIMAYPKQNVSYLKLHYERKTKKMLKQLGVLKNYDEENMPEHMLKVVRKLKIAFDNYVFKPLDIKIDLFIAQQRIYYLDDPKYLGWQAYALDGINLYSVASNHNEIFDHPYDKILADMLQRRLNQINK